MNLSSLFGLMRQILGSLCQILLQPVRCWTKPDNHAPIPNAALDLPRSKSELMLENALLRQQLIVLQRQTKRPKLTWRDRALLVLLASKLRAWEQALIIVQPDTLLRWHRNLFRRIWRRKSKPREKRGRKPLTVMRHTHSPFAYSRFLNRNTFQESFLATVVTLPPSNLAAELTDGTIAFGFSYELAALMSSV
jgi:hypothetical protein